MHYLKQTTLVPVLLREEARVVNDPQQIGRFGFWHEVAESEGGQVFFGGTFELHVDDRHVHKVDLGQPLGQFVQVGVVA